VSATVVIPARLGSTRFPEKILAASTGRPLVQHVVDQARRCRNVAQVIVAADDRRVVDALQPFETRVVLTDPNHPSGTDRIAEVARTLGDDLIINVQGDEPEIEPETIDALIDRMGKTGNRMGTVITPFAPPRDPNDPNIVKCIVALDGTAIYFSRHPIPFRRDAAGPTPTYFHHLGIYGFRRDFLLEFATWKPTPLEQIEKLEQLRAIEHGIRIDTITIAKAPAGIDTPEQYQAFINRLKVVKHPASDARGST
jgi:3-deoxy-manno-octulosonate cytidylyltransferase (CMP-KDO synthetase)